MHVPGGVRTRPRPGLDRCWSETGWSCARLPRIRHGKAERSHVREIEEAELEKPAAETRWDDARALFDRVALEEEFEEFLTLPAYEYLD